jgi:hypothetical protein
MINEIMLYFNSGFIVHFFAPIRYKVDLVAKCRALKSNQTNKLLP